jgi:hypothetical protein
VSLMTEPITGRRWLHLIGIGLLLHLFVMWFS